MKKGWKIAGIIVIVLVILFFGVQWWLGYKIKHILEDKLTEQTRGTVLVEVGGVDVRLISRTVYLRDIRIATDSAQRNSQDLPFSYLKGNIGGLLVSGVRFKNQDSLLTFCIRKLDVQAGELFVRMSKSRDKSAWRRNTDGNAEKLKVNLENLHIEFRNLCCEQYQPGDTVSYQMKNFNCDIQTLHLDTRKDSVKDQVSFKDIRVSFDQIRNMFAERSQLLEIDSLQLNGKEGALSMGSVKLLPQYPEAIFAEKAPGHVDWTKVVTDKITFRGFNIQKIWRDGIVNIDSIDIQGAHIASYKNRQIEQQKKIKRLFYESVQEFPLRFWIHRVNLSQINVEYQELSKRGLSPGKITFIGLSGIFDDLTNIIRKDNPYFTLKAWGKLMDQGEIQATFLLPVDSLNNHFQVEGSLGKMSCLALNPMTEPLAKISITSGEIDGMTFTITGNSKDARVNMVFLYRDLRIRIMKEKDGKLETRSFFTTLANGLIAKGNNPDHGGIRKAKGTAERDLYRSQFNYLWRTLLSGLKETLGISF